jgi:hypothetical protein
MTLRTSPLPANLVSFQPAEEINHQHQLDRVQRALTALNAAKKLQSEECNKLARMKPTDGGFDAQANTLASATKELIAARNRYLICARSI